MHSARKTQTQLARPCALTLCFTGAGAGWHMLALGRHGGPAGTCLSFRLGAWFELARFQQGLQEVRAYKRALDPASADRREEENAWGLAAWPET